MLSSGGMFVVAARDVRVHFASPTTYVAAVFLLVVQGLSFMGVVKVTADPLRPAPLGAVFQSLFGQTFLFWVVLFAITAALAMEAIASERRTGLWETTLTNRVSVGSVVAGKWCAAFFTYLVLWLPTVLYIPLLSFFRASEAPIDIGPIVSGYVGVALIGAALLALAFPFSAATARPLFALVAALALFAVWLALGEFDNMGGLEESPNLFSASLDLRQQMGNFSRGWIDGSAIVALCSVVVLALMATNMIVCRGRRRDGGRRMISFLFVAVGCVATIATAAENGGFTWDWTRSQQHSLDPRTRSTLDEVRAATDVVIVRPQSDVYLPAVLQIEQLLRRMARQQPLLRTTAVDAVADPTRAKLLVETLGISLRDAVTGGTVILYRGQRSVLVDLSTMTEFSADKHGVLSLAHLRAEKALVAALGAITASDSFVVCRTRDGGEFDETRLSRGFDSWRTQGAVFRELVSPLSLSACSVVLIAARQRPMDGQDVLALDDFLSKGGALLLILDSEVEKPDSGLRSLLADRGVSWSKRVRLRMGASAVVTGYSDHPVTQSLIDREATLWVRPLSLRVRGNSAEALVELPASDLVDQQTAVVAAATTERGRVVVFGSAEAFSDASIAMGAQGNRTLLVSAMNWLREQRFPLEWNDRTPERIRLRVGATQRRWLFASTVVVMPLVVLFLGVLLWWWRHHE